MQMAYERQSKPLLLRRNSTITTFKETSRAFVVRLH